MTWTFHEPAVTANSKIAGTTVASAAFTTGNYLPAIGDIVVVYIGLDNTATVDGASTTVTAVADTRGNTYTRAREATNTVGGAAGDGVALAIWYSNVTIAFQNNDAVTATHASLTARGIGAYAFTPTNVNGGSLDATSAENHTDASDPASFTLTPAGGSREYLWIYGLGTEGPNGDASTADTGNGWTLGFVDRVGTSGGSAVTNACVSGAYQIATASSKTCDWTYTARDNQQLLLAFTENAAAGGAAPIPGLTLAPMTHG